MIDPREDWNPCKSMSEEGKLGSHLCIYPHLWRRHPVIMSAFLQALWCELTFQVWGQRCIFHAAAQEADALHRLCFFFPCEMWRVMARKIFRSVSRLQTGCNGCNTQCFFFFFSNIRLCLLQDFWQVKTSYATPLFWRAQPHYLRNQLVTKEIRC